MRYLSTYVPNASKHKLCETKTDAVQQIATKVHTDYGSLFEHSTKPNVRTASRGDIANATSTANGQKVATPATPKVQAPSVFQILAGM